MTPSLTDYDLMQSLDSLQFSRETLAEMTLPELIRAQNDAQDEYEKRARRLAALLVVGTLSLAAWYTQMQELVKRHLLQQVLLGGRGRLADPIRTRGLVRRELAYLLRFANEVGTGQLSEAQIANRAAMYGGSARGEFYREQELDAPAGFVFEYVSQDDDNTCDPCFQAEGYYLAGKGPMPGQVCLGRARCRCTRLRRERPDIYESLIDQGATGRLFHPEVTAHAG